LVRFAKRLHSEACGKVFPPVVLFYHPDLSSRRFDELSYRESDRPGPDDQGGLAAADSAPAYCVGADSESFYKGKFVEGKGFRLVQQ
jgi:hypothetical protein